MDTSFDNQQPTQDLTPSAKLALMHAQAAQDQESRVESVTTLSSGALSGDLSVGEADDTKEEDVEIVVAEPAREPTPKKKVGLDLDSESAFPSLSSSSRPAAVSGWGAGGSARLKQASPSQSSAPHTPAAKKTRSIVTDTLELAREEQIANQPNKPLGFKSAAESIKQIMSKTSTTINASTSRAGTITYLIQGKEADVARAKRDILANLAVKLTVQLEVPSSTQRFIIGAKGATLKQIQNISGTRINVPKRETSEPTEIDDEDAEDVPVSITIVGDADGVKIAKAEILKIVGEKTATQTVKLNNIDSHYYPLIAGADNKKVKALADELDVKIRIPTFSVVALVEAENESDEQNANKVETAIVISGDREKVQLAKQTIEKTYADLERVCGTVKFEVNKRQHRFIIGKNATNLMDILEQTGCTVELPSSTDSSEEVVIRGPKNKLPSAMALAFEKANSVHVQILDLTRVNKSAADHQKHGQNLLRYLMYGSKLKQLEAEHGVQIIVPRGSIAEQKPVLEFVGKEEAAVEKSVQAVDELARSLHASYFGYAIVEPHFHRHIIGRKGQNIQRLSEAHAVSIITPDEKEDNSEILLVFEGKPSELEGLDQKTKDTKIKESLAAASAELTKMAADISDFTTKTIKVPAKYHGAIIGPKRTTLNAIIGSGADNQVFVKFGSAAPSGDKPRNADLPEDAIVIRGPTEEVNRVVQEINRVHEEAKHEDFLNSYVTECVIPAEYSAHVIGKAGANINKLKDDLGVKIDIEDGKAKSEATPTKTAAKNEKVKVTIKGIKVNVEAAKERILGLIDALADRTVTILSIPRQYHKSLIGTSGRYVKKLEDKYSVRIQFPRSDVSADASDDNSSEVSSVADKSSTDEITMSGGKKGVAAAKAELLELYEYEVENNKVETFTFDAKHLPHIVGRNGAKVKEIKDETQARIDFNKPVDGVVTTSLQGTKESIANAKKAILEAIRELDSQVTETIKISSEHHKRLIGAGGRNIRSIVVEAGGSDDRAATMVRFPRPEDDVQDEIVLKGDKEIVAKIRAKLEQLVAEEEALVTIKVDIPRDEHANLIGRGGSTLKALQKKYNVRIDFPKVGQASAAEAVTIAGLPEDCEKCKAEMLSKVRATHEMLIPRKQHATVAGSNGATYRKLRNEYSVTVDHKGESEPKANKKTSALNGSAARIDTVDSGDDFALEIIENQGSNEEGDITWVLKGDQKNIERAQKYIKNLLRDAQNQTHTGYLTVPQSMHRYIVGRQGATISRIRNESDTNILVPNKDGDVVVITGTRAGIEMARDLILEVVDKSKNRD
ncbi:hypothetical protein BGW37DRAFT_476269 [Umbelopsis sp. PMI_123]|nr:hypothetical protein BGW37DRAFT_476269 [Umbelopsis sp. PMI_123]